MPASKSSIAGEYAPSTLCVEEGQSQLHRSETIGTLPDDVLLEIFCFYMGQSQDIEGWIMLVHVCQRWRNIVFASPRRLHLRLLCKDTKPVREMLDIWPALPIVICDSELMTNPWCRTKAEDKLVAAFEHKGRICEISLRHIQSSRWESFSYCLEGSLPALECLKLCSKDWLNWGESVPDSFLGGSAPNLKTLHLDGVRRCPPIPPLLLSASGLVHLHLSGITIFRPISPGTMATCLSTLTKLQTFTLRLPAPLSPRSPPDPTSQQLPQATRTVLPFLSQFQFRGTSEYLEDLLAHITAPLLRRLDIVFYGDVPILGTSQLHQFISCAERLNSPNRANVVFDNYSAIVTLFSRVEAFDRTILEVNLNSAPGGLDFDSRLSSLARIYNSTLPPLTTLESLHITEGPRFPPTWLHSVGNSQWLDFLHQFTTVKNLYLSDELSLHVAPVFRELVAEGRTDVLPTLQNLFLGGRRPSRRVQEAIEQFLAARRHSGCPVAVHHCERERL
ncbi:hypothetical protein BC826DRAFT_1108236 [Russula brevipes]|nr:hypothetical protein BC826DRAFT_1108236 [Russula brevipes]